jgi:hypothetical protein
MDAAPRALQALVLPVPEAEGLVDDFRRHGDWSRRVGIPAHITLGGPWPLEPDLPAAELKAVSAEGLDTSFSLDRVETLGSAVCLLPSDPRTLEQYRDRLLASVGLPDVTDRRSRIHLTICREASAELLADVRKALEPALPLRCRTDRVRLVRFSAAGTLSTLVLT